MDSEGMDRELDFFFFGYYSTTKIIFFVTG